MKLRDIFNKVVNKSNNQIVLNPKKKLVKSMGYDDIDDLLDIKVENKLKKFVCK